MQVINVIYMACILRVSAFTGDPCNLAGILNVVNCCRQSTLFNLAGILDVVGCCRWSLLLDSG